MRKFPLGLLIEIMMQKTKTAEFCVEFVHMQSISKQLLASTKGILAHVLLLVITLECFQ
jgi:hypothetical protein